MYLGGSWRAGDASEEDEEGETMASRSKDAGSEWDANVVVTARREVADIPLSFIKEGFLSTFARRSFFLSRASLCLVAAAAMFFSTRFVLSVSCCTDTAAVHLCE